MNQRIKTIFTRFRFSETQKRKFDEGVEIWNGDLLHATCYSLAMVKKGKHLDTIKAKRCLFRLEAKCGISAIAIQDFFQPEIKSLNEPNRKKKLRGKSRKQVRISLPNFEKHFPDFKPKPKQAQSKGSVWATSGGLPTLGKR